MTDTLHTIHRSIRAFFSGTLLSRISGMLRDMSMAYVFGTKASIAAFMVAFRLAHTLRRLLGEGALQAAFIPEFEELRRQNEKQAFSFFRDLTLTLTCLLTTLIALLCGALFIFLSKEKVFSDREVFYLTFLMLPSVLFICLYGVNASFLQCQKKYFIPSMAPVAFNFVWILGVFHLQNIPAQEAMPILALYVVAACFFQWLCTVPSTHSEQKNINIRSIPRQFFSQDMRRLIRPLLLGMLGVAASQINHVVDSLFAFFADPEGPAILWYAMRIQQLPLALFGIAISSAILPPLSRAAKSQRPKDYLHFLQHGLFQTWAFMLPLTALIFLMGDACVNLLYGRGDFSLHSIMATTHCLWAYSWGLIPSALILILAPACYAKNNYRLPAFAAFATIICNTSLNILFIQGFGWGAISVAMATSISAWGNFFWLSYYFSRQGINLFSSSILQRGFQTIFATLAASFVTYGFRQYIFKQPLFDFISLPRSFFDQFYLFSGQLIVFAGIFFLFIYKSYFKNPSRLPIQETIID
jgi:putative peptidoglycan lipid II flippase